MSTTSFCHILLFAIFLISGQIRIRGDDDPGLVYIPVGPTSDFRTKIPAHDQQGDANTSLTTTASPFGKKSFLSKSLISTVNDSYTVKAA
jgi:hypothetical protein